MAFELGPDMPPACLQLVFASSGSVIASRAGFNYNEKHIINTS